MVNINYDKWAIGNSILFPAKHKDPYLIPYYYKVELDSLLIPDDNDHIDDMVSLFIRNHYHFTGLLKCAYLKGRKYQ